MKPIIIFPGEILLEDYLKPMKISAETLASSIGVSAKEIQGIILGNQNISPEMSICLGAFFKQGPRFWYNLQTTCDFEKLKVQEKQITAKVRHNYQELLTPAFSM